MLNWCSSLFIYSVNKYFLILYLLAVSFSWISCVPAHRTREALTALCPTISFHGCSYREWPWKVDIVSPLEWRTHSYCHCPTFWILYTQGSCLVPQPSCVCSYHLTLLLSPCRTWVGSGNWGKSASVLATAIVVISKLSFISDPESHVFSQHPWNCTDQLSGFQVG